MRFEDEHKITVNDHKDKRKRTGGEEKDTEEFKCSVLGSLVTQTLDTKQLALHNAWKSHQNIS